MFGQREVKRVKICSLIGVHLIVASSTFMWLFGNLSAYATSYVYFHGGADQAAYMEWILSIYLASSSPGFFVAGYMAKRIGLKWTGITSMVVFNTGLLLSAWTVQASGLATALLMGGFTGFSLGVSLCITYNLVQDWSPAHSAFFLGSVSCGPNLLASIQNQMITEYVNPGNLKADARVGPNVFFSQRRLLQRVPGAILLLGLMTLCIQIVGYLLVSNPPDTKQPITDSGDSSNTLDLGKARAKEPNSYHETNNVSDVERQVILHIQSASTQALYTDSDRVNQNEAAFELDSQKPEQFDRKTDSWIHSAELDDRLPSTNGELGDLTGNSTDVTPRSFKPNESVRTLCFWVIWLSNVAFLISITLKNNYYKRFGLLYIDDDKLLTLVGTLMSVTSPVCKVAFGWLLDRGSLNIQDLCVVSLAINTAICALWYLSARLSGLVYMFAILLLGAGQSGSYILMPAAALRLFGHEHFSYNLSMLMSPYLIVSLPFSFLISPFLAAVGWYWLFTASSLLSLIALGLAASTKLRTA